MKKQIVTQVILIIISFFSLTIYGQNGKIKKANKLYHKYSYEKAIDKFLSVEEKGIDVNRKLADCYFKLHQYQKAEEFASLVANSDKPLPLDLYRYAYVLRLNEKYTESNTWMQKFHEIHPSDTRGKQYQNPPSVGVLIGDTNRFEIKNLDINSPQQDFGVSYYADDVVYASSNTFLSHLDRTWNGNSLPFLNLYKAKTDDSGAILNPVSFHKKINRKFHEGPATFTKDGNYIVFTSDHYKEKSSEKARNLMLRTQKKEGDTWVETDDFHFNNKEYSFGQPSISGDGEWLYFASDMPGGIGGTDIYRSKKNADGTWGSPENLGKEVNTEGNEMFPFIHEKSILFFSSDGHVGLGGLDVFAVKEGKKGFKNVVHLDAPLNGSKDDFAFVLNEEEQKGYFSSNRAGGKGNDDIYSFNLKKPLELGKKIEGYAKTSDGVILSNVLVQLYNGSLEEMAQVTTDETGYYSFEIVKDDVYHLKGSKPKFSEAKNSGSTEGKMVTKLDLMLDNIIGLNLLVTDADTKQPIEGVEVIIKNREDGKELYAFSTPTDGSWSKIIRDLKIGDEMEYVIHLEATGYAPKTLVYTKTIDEPKMYNLHEELNMMLHKLDVGKDLATLIDIQPIYFDLNKFNIRPDAALELDKIVKIMTEYPNMEIELGSHTDCRGSKAYNTRLSQQRATSSAKYIKSRIKNPARIYGKGYGETQLKNGCACEGTQKSDCTEEEHQANRRTEFIIKKM